jgi:6-pyruvoyltetrahydropterin/6-carboxytetrahydropterin synthase
MPTVYLTRRETFNAAHRLWVDGWTEERNFEVFGKCANRHYHGHNYQLFVTVKGTPDPITGFIMDVKDLGKLIRREISDVLDHTNLSIDPNFMPKDIQPTTENLVIYIWRQLEHHLPNGVSLHSVKLVETENIYAEYFGD